MSFNSGMENKLTAFRAKTIYRVVTVIQAPFMQWNATTSKFHNRMSNEFVDEEDLEMYLNFKRLTMKNDTKMV